MNFDITKFLEKYYTNEEPIVLACSTGPDSMFLLYKILDTKYAKNLVACYFNHHLRDDSNDEEQWLVDLGKKKGFSVEIGEAKIKEIREKFYPSISLEEVAREKRYAFLNAILNVYNCDKIITGHHLDDRIETFFFNLNRGSKLTGLINMKEHSGNILRPLLQIEKKEIIEYLKNNNFEYNIDSTNKDNNITRNYLRNEILPKFENINNNYKSNINNLIHYFEDIKDHIDKEVEYFLKEQGIKIFNSGKYKINTLEIYGYFYIDDYNSLSELLQKEVIRHIFYISNHKSTIGLTESNISEVIRFINGKNNKTIKEIKNMKLEKENEIIICR